MKQSLLLTGFIVLVAGFCHAQTLIPRVGVTMSTMDLDFLPGVTSKTGFTVGVGYNLALNERFSIQPELNFVQKGHKRSSEESGSGEGQTYATSASRSLTVNYVELPVLAKVTFGTRTKFYLNAGPSLGVGIGGKDRYREASTISWEGDPVIRHYSSDFKGKVKFGDEASGYMGYTWFRNRFDLGAQFGGGVLIAGKIMVDLRYDFGFSNLYGRYPGERSQHRVMQFAIGVPISLK